MRRLLTLVLLCASCLVPLVGAPTATATPPADLVVDDDGAQCGPDTYSTIQSAVDQASAGDRVWICPGRYSEHVRVSASISMYGRPDEVAAIPCSAPETGDPDGLDPTVVPILEPPDTVEAPILQIDADDVDVSGLVVQGFDDQTRTEVAPGYTVIEPAVGTSEVHAGWRMHHNLFRLNGLSVELGSDGSAPVRLDHNCFRDNDYAGGNQRLLLSDARIDHNESFGTAILAWEIGWGYRAAAHVRVDHNSSLRDARGALVENAADVSLDNNTVTAPGVLGMQVRPGSDHVTLRDNLVTGAGSGSAFSIGTQGANTAPLPAATDIVVTDNVGSGNGQSGLVAVPGANATDVLITDNVFDANTTGVLLGAGTVGYLIRGNVAEINRGNGIRLAPGTAGNLLEGNVLLGNTVTDARDESGVPLRNTWTGNRCVNDFPAGSIC